MALACGKRSSACGSVAHPYFGLEPSLVVAAALGGLTLSFALRAVK